MDKLSALNAVKNTEKFDDTAFDEAKEILKMIWTGQVSASMSGIEMYEPIAGWIIDQARTLSNGSDECNNY